LWEKFAAIEEDGAIDRNHSDHNYLVHHLFCLLEKSPPFRESFHWQNGRISQRITAITRSKRRGQFSLNWPRSGVLGKDERQACEIKSGLTRGEIESRHSQAPVKARNARSSIHRHLCPMEQRPGPRKTCSSAFQDPGGGVGKMRTSMRNKIRPSVRTFFAPRPTLFKLTRKFRSTVGWDYQASNCKQSWFGRLF
jgi:hypothetical protein